jgi:WXG100 family type VII secretion target
MSDGMVSMDFTRMANCIQDLQTYTKQIRNWVTILETNAEKSLASWDGDAKAQYYAEKQIWNSAITDMEQGLGMHGQALTNITDTTMSGERRNTARWNGAGKPA